MSITESPSRFSERAIFNSDTFMSPVESIAEHLDAFSVAEFFNFLAPNGKHGFETGREEFKRKNPKEIRFNVPTCFDPQDFFGHLLDDPSFRRFLFNVAKLTEGRPAQFRLFVQFDSDGRLVSTAIARDEPHDEVREKHAEVASDAASQEFRMIDGRFERQTHSEEFQFVIQVPFQAEFEAFGGRAS